MKKLTPKGIIGLSSTAFLFLILMSIIYLNNQVQFNTIEAKWELAEQYTIQESVISSSSIIDYDINYLQGYEYNTGFGTGPESGDSQAWATEKILIQNDSLLIDTPFSISILVYDNNNYLGVYRLNHNNALSSAEISENTYLGQFQNNVLLSNATHFAFVGYGFSFETFVATSFAQFETINPQYEIVNITDTSIDSYQVFENIRNNATTVNPLGFMNTLVSIPSQAVGYFKSFMEFLSFDIADGIQTWWRDKLLGPESGYWSLVELIQTLGD